MRDRSAPMLPSKKQHYSSDYKSDRVFVGTRKVSADDVARLRARYKDYKDRVLDKKDAPPSDAPDKKKPA
jgi:hypothetical protein